MDSQLLGKKDYLLTRRRSKTNSTGVLRRGEIAVVIALGVMWGTMYLFCRMLLTCFIDAVVNSRLSQELSVSIQRNEQLEADLQERTREERLYQDINFKLNYSYELMKLVIFRLWKRDELFYQQRNKLTGYIRLAKFNLTELTTSLEQSSLEKDQLRDGIIQLSRKVNILKHDIAVLKQQSNSKFINSVILKSESELSLLHQWIGLGFTLKYNLLYRGSACAFSVKLFHLKCDSSTMPLLLIIHTVSGLTIGGFMTQSTSGRGKKEDNKAFLFSLSDHRRYKINDPGNAYFCEHSLFLYFGQGDLIIHPNEIESFFPISYGELFEEIPLSLTRGSNVLKYDEIEAFSIEMIKR